MAGKYFEAQTQLIGTIVGIGFVYYLFTLILPFVGAWFSRSKRKQQELDRLARRQAATQAERKELEEMVEKEERRAREAKKDGEKKQHGKSSNVDKFRFPERQAADDSSNPKVDAAPAPARARVGTRHPAPTPAHAAINPWASFTMPAAQNQGQESSLSARSSAYRRERERQDQEYFESLQADVERKRREEDVQEKKREQEEISGTLRESVAALVPREPREADPEAVTISFRIMGLGGKDKIRFSRRFRASETINDVLNFWRAHALVDANDMNKVEICSCHPMHALPQGSELRFYHREVVLVRVNN